MIQYVKMKKDNQNTKARRGVAAAGFAVAGDASGQAAVEYVLVISILTIGITLALMYGLNDALQTFFDEIAAYVSLPFP